MADDTTNSFFYSNSNSNSNRIDTVQFLFILTLMIAIVTHVLLQLLQKPSTSTSTTKQPHPSKSMDDDEKKKQLPYFVYVNPITLFREYSDRKPLYWQEFFVKYKQDTITISMLPYWLQCVLVPICRVLKICEEQDLVVPHSVVVITRDGAVARKVLTHGLKPTWLFKTQAVLLSEPGFVTVENFRSRHVRKTIGLAFHKQNVERIACIVQSYFTEWVDRLAERCTDEISINISDEIHELILRGVVKGLFEYDLSNEEYTMYPEQLKEAWDYKSTAYNMVFSSFTPGYGKIRNEIGSKMRAMFHRCFDQYKKSGKNVPDSIIQYLIDDPNYTSDNHRIDDAIAITNGGFESTSTSIIFVILELCRDKALQRRLRLELQAVREEERERLPLLCAIVLENARRHPVAGAASPRTLTRNLEFDNFLIPRTNLVVASIFCILHNEAYYPNPEKFDFSRWENMSEQGINSNIPFSFGRRSCVGTSLAKTIIYKSLAYMFSQDFEYSIVDEGTPSYKHTYMISGTKIHAKAIKRDHIETGDSDYT